MASFSDRVKVLIDVDSTGATSGLVNFRKSFSEAQTATDKWKTITGGAMDFVKNNAMTMAAGAGAAIAGFAVKAIGDFQKLALEVDHFSDVTGLASEDASRWVEVAGDMGIESATVESAINRMNREISKSPEKFEELGIQLERTSGGAIDVNTTFLNVIQRLKETEDPATRARIAAELLGKGWTGMAELVETGADQLKASLQDVSDQKVINEAEIEKAKELRAAQDALGDALDDLTLTIGQNLIPAFSSAVAAAEPFVKVLGFVTDATMAGSDANKTYAEDISNNNVSMNLGMKIAEKFFGIFGIGKDKIEDVTGATEEMTTTWVEGYRAMIDARDAADDLVYSLEDVDYALSVLKGNVDERQAWRNLQDSFDQVKQKAIEAFTEGTPEAIRDSEGALDNLRLKVGEYITEIDNISTEKKTEFLAKIDTATFAELEDLLDFLSRRREVEFVPTVNGRPIQPGDTPSESRRIQQMSDTGYSGRVRKPPSLDSNTLAAYGPEYKKQVEEALLAMGGTKERNTVTVNVMGSVLSSEDLVEKIRRALIEEQRSGKQLVYTGP